MSRWLAMAERAEENSKPLPANRPEPAERGADASGKVSERPKGGFLPVSTGLPVKGFKEAQDPAATVHGTSIGGRPLTWTGKVVSLAAWRDMTAWERHGPDGKTFNGKTMKWESEV